MRILMVSRGVVPIGPRSGGAELAAYQLSRQLAKRGHAVTLVADVVEAERRASPDVEFVEINSLVHRLALRLPSGFFSWMVQHLTGNLTAMQTARRLLRRQFDVVHAHGSLSTLLLSRATSLPLVYTEHDAPPWRCRYRRWWERLIRMAVYRMVNGQAWQCADRIAATFQALREDIQDRGDISSEGVFVIANGTDTDIFCPVPDSDSPVNESRAPVSKGFGGNGPNRKPDGVRFDRYCLFVGRLTPRKAPDLLLQALSEAPDVCCVFAGDGPMRRQLEQLAHRMGLRSRVAFLGTVDSSSLPRIYAGADLLVLPSVSEASPLVAIEAMASGTPVLGTRIAGVPTVVEDYQTGFLVDPSNRGALSVALRFLTRDRALLAEMGRKAQAKIRERYTWPLVAVEYETVYRSTLRAGDQRQIPVSPSAQKQVAGLEKRRRLLRARHKISV